MGSKGSPGKKEREARKAERKLARQREREERQDGPGDGLAPGSQATGPVARSRPCWCRPGSSSPAPPRSRRSAARTKKGKKTVEVVYLITSDRDADPATLAAWVRGHWEIENRLHWVRDVTYQEDKSLVRTGNAPRVMASLRSLAISLLRLGGQANIAAANRHHARDPQRTLKLLQTA
jgi:predicted transposase YbfD/YdcC